MTTPSRERMLRLVELACRAPSVHNTQPWLWRIVDDATIELLADRSRQLPVADPDGRNLAISCGAALHHATEVAGALGMVPKVEVTPDVTDHDLLARIHLSAGRPVPDAGERLAAIEQRCTDRRRFTSWPVPDARLHKLAEAASGWGTFAVPLTDVTARFRAELLMDRAMVLQASDPRFAEEQARWIERAPTDGIPAPNAVPPGSGRVGRPNRFVTESQPGTTRSPRLIESSDGLVAICSAYDAQMSWIQAGQTLSALWLNATGAGLSIVPLSQAVEVPETRQALHRDVFSSMARPLILVRVGWQEISRSTLPRTPRRPLAQVLVR